MLRTIKIRLYPNKEQTTMINKLLGLLTGYEKKKISNFEK